MEVLKILVIDDEVGIRSGVNRILNNYKVNFPFLDDEIVFEVKEAASGEEGIEIINADNPQVILLDNKLPGMQGLEVLEYIQREKIDALVVMITSYASLEVAVQATRKGAYDFIPKPFTPQELRTTMETVARHVFLRGLTKQLNTQGKVVRFRFLSVLSHELKTPLNIIEGYLKMMKERQAGNDLSAYEEVIDRSLFRIQNMRNLIFDLLDLTRIETGQKERKLLPVNLAKIAALSIDTFTPLAIQKSVKIIYEGPSEVFLDAMEEEIEIVFNNLLSNAIKYNKNEGEVRLIIEPKVDHIIVMVKDTGIGMNEEEVKRVFEEFVRIKNAKTQNISGSGLGLSIVKKICEYYNAEIKVSSKENQGTTIIIKFNKTKYE
ncbi:MAG: hybrid sensor histidine kinase/response regulator [Bacteroidales bacterium]|nr:hybrid sensor histidine kinase/response regulator [Bacteroidales bacterium]